MTCRDEILEVARMLADRRLDGTFSVLEVLAEMHARDTPYAGSTIRGYIITKMCSNAPKSSSTHYQDLERVGPGAYRLVVSLSHAGSP